MGRSDSSTDAFVDGRGEEQPEHSVTVGAFKLDKYEVTVSRMRNFVNAYDSWRAAGHPHANEGSNPNVTVVDTGWSRGWSIDTDAAALVTNLQCDPKYGTWSSAGNDTHPINCVSYYQAFLFCLWDGGRLPTEAEWEYVAAGGDENRLYPWGPDAPNPTRATYYLENGTYALIPVGTLSAGAGRWGHLDLAGSLWEWVVDSFMSNWYSQPSATGSNVVNPPSAGWHALKGGGYVDTSDYMRVTVRIGSMHNAGDISLDTKGIRCARDSVQ